MQHHNTPLTKTPDHVKIGRRTYPFASFADTSHAYRAAIEATNATASGETGPLAPRCTIHAADGEQIAYVSYNGRVWAGTDYVAGSTPLYAPGL